MAASPLPASRRCAPRTRLRLTARGRRLVAAAAALPAVAALCAAMLAGGAALADDTGAPTDSFETVTVRSGDSLWSIAAVVAPASDPRDVVDGIIRLNALDGARIVPGQELALPAEYTP